MSAFDRLCEIADEPWGAVSLPAWIGTAAFALVVLVCAHRGEHWVPILDNANLVFHEAGHPLFGIVAERLAVYGGTLGQLAFPLVVAASFWAKRHAASFACALIWLASNFFNIARYMADARAKQLPLIGGLDPEYAHDWAEILGRWGLLAWDGRLAFLVRGAGWLILVGAIAWLAWRALPEREDG